MKDALLTIDRSKAAFLVVMDAEYLAAAFLIFRFRIRHRQNLNH
ncbi:hypothetical protein ACFLQW_03335 [Candidatus Zixiibacteriota bacterium]